MSILVTGHCRIILWICLLPIECLFDRSYALKICMDLLYHRLLAITLCDWIHLAIDVYHWTLKNYIIWCRWFGLVLDKQAVYLDNRWLKLLISIILDKQDIYLDVTLPLKLLDEHYYRVLSLNEHYHCSLIGVIDHYHCSRNKTYLENIQQHCLDKLYLMVLIDEHYYLDTLTLHINIYYFWQPKAGLSPHAHANT